MLILFNLLSLKKEYLFNELKCAFFTRKHVVFFRYLSDWVLKNFNSFQNKYRFVEIFAKV